MTAPDFEARSASGAPVDGDADVTRLVTLPGPEADPEATRMVTFASLDEGSTVMVQGQGHGSLVVGVGTRINNNYVITEPLRSGGMGQVYRGENLHTGEPVAIKVILAQHAADEKFSAMFLREATTLNRVADDAVVRYLNFLHDPDIDRYCLVMEFIPGRTLSDYITATGPLDASAALKLLQRLARGLLRAHENHIVHRDLSPDNIMLPAASIDSAKIIDFGVAKANVVNDATAAGGLVGKLKYMSPEQLGLYGGQVSPATDVYSLALLIAMTLRGTAIDMGRNVAEAVETRRQVPDLSDLPVPLRPLLEHMLQPDPAARPQSMADVIRAAERVLALPSMRRGSPQAGPVPQRGLSLPPTGSSGLSLPPTTLTSRTGVTASGVSRRPGPQRDMSETTPDPGLDGSAGGLWIKVIGAAALVIAASALAWVLLGQQAYDPGEDPSPATASGTREGLLASSYVPGSCALVVRSTDGGLVGLSEGGVDFRPVQAAYEEAFGIRSDVRDRRIAAGQCAVLDFVSALMARQQTPLALSTDQEDIIPGSDIQGNIKRPPGEGLWLFLVDEEGRLTNVSGRVEDFGDDRPFSIPISGWPESTVPQLLVAVATPKALTVGPMALNGSRADTVLPAAGTAIAEGGVSASVGIVYLTLQGRTAR